MHVSCVDIVLKNYVHQNHLIQKRESFNSLSIRSVYLRTSYCYIAIYTLIMSLRIYIVLYNSNKLQLSCFFCIILLYIHPAVACAWHPDRQLQLVARDKHIMLLKFPIVFFTYYSQNYSQ